MMWRRKDSVSVKYAYLLFKTKHTILYCVLDFVNRLDEEHCRSPPLIDSKKLSRLEELKMQYVVDTYVLEYLENEDKYYISFKDSVEKDCRMEIDKEIYEAYMKSKAAYVKIKNETDRHLDISELTEIDIFNKSANKEKSVEDIVISNIQKEKIEEAKKKLTETQIRRIELHIVNEITIRDLAKRENVRKKQIEKSIQLGLKKIKKFFEN